MIFKNFAGQDWIGFNFIGSGLDSDCKISQSAHLWTEYSLGTVRACLLDCCRSVFAEICSCFSLVWCIWCWPRNSLRGFTNALVVSWMSCYRSLWVQLGNSMGRGATSSSFRGRQFSWNFIAWRHRAYSTVLQLFR